MAEFKIIETQEQLDAIIGERIARAEKKAAEKFADYDEIKKQNGDFKTQMANLQNQLKSQGETDKSRIEELESKVNQYATAAAKTKIALEAGLPFDLADKLSGANEDEIRADAQKMAKYFVSQSAPIGSPEPEPSNGKSSDSAFFQLAHEIGKDE